MPPVEQKTDTYDVEIRITVGLAEEGLVFHNNKFHGTSGELFKFTLPVQASNFVEASVIAYREATREVSQAIAIGGGKYIKGDIVIMSVTRRRAGVPE